MNATVERRDDLRALQARWDAEAAEAERMARIEAEYRATAHLLDRWVLPALYTVIAIGLATCAMAQGMKWIGA